MPKDLPEVGPWAREKLDRLQKYLSAYTTVMKGQKWAEGYVYIDAFAGAGQSIVRPSGKSSPVEQAILAVSGARSDSEAQQLIDGSPRVALGLGHPFSRYVFLERDLARLKILRHLEEEYRGRRSVKIHETDCNAYLEKLVSNPRINWRKWRAVIFLDPFGMQVPWATIEGLAKTRAIEIFINFPVGMAIQRLLKRSGEFTQKQRAKLDTYFGDPGWHQAVYEEGPGLFGSMKTKPGGSGNRLVAWYRTRLSKTFGFASAPYLVCNTKGGHLYYLLFAGPNKTGATIAGNVLGGGTKE